MSVVTGWVYRTLRVANGPRATTKTGLKSSKSSSSPPSLCRRSITRFPISPPLLLATSASTSRSYCSGTMDSASQKESVDATENLDFHDLLNYAAKHGPGFPVDPKSISVVRDPSQFFDELAVRILALKFDPQVDCVGVVSNFQLSLVRLVSAQLNRA